MKEGFNEYVARHTGAFSTNVYVIDCVNSRQLLPFCNECFSAYRLNFPTICLQ